MNCRALLTNYFLADLLFTGVNSHLPDKTRARAESRHILCIEIDYDQ